MIHRLKRLLRRRWDVMSADWLRARRRHDAEARNSFDGPKWRWPVSLEKPDDWPPPPPPPPAFTDPGTR